VVGAGGTLSLEPGGKSGESNTRLKGTEKAEVRLLANMAAGLSLTGCPQVTNRKGG